MGPLPLPSLSLSPSFTPIASLCLPLSKGSGAQGFGTERARLVVQVERLWCTRFRYRTCKTSGSSQIRCTRLRHRTCKTSGSSQKKGLLPMGISIFFSQKYPRFSNLKLDFFPIEKLLHKTFFLANFIISELIMSEVSKDLRNIFFPKIPPIFELEV